MILKLDSVRKNYGERNILSDVALWLHPGQITALFGRNGEGKTTLFKLLVGLEKADQMHLKYGEENLITHQQKTTFINYLPQHHLRRILFEYLKMPNLKTYLEVKEERLNYS